MKIGDFIRVTWTDRPQMLAEIRHMPSDTGDFLYVLDLQTEREVAINPCCSSLEIIEVTKDDSHGR